MNDKNTNTLIQDIIACCQSTDRIDNICSVDYYNYNSLKNIDIHLANESRLRNSLSIIAKGTNNNIYDIDIVYASSNSIFLKNTIDYGWSIKQDCFQAKNVSTVNIRIVVYLCEPNILVDREDLIISNGYRYIHQKLPRRYLLNQVWNEVHHLYLDLAVLDLRSVDLEKLKSFAVIPSEIEQKEDPLVSVVTVVFNGEDYLEQTIQSVINQSYQNLEYIIIDGGSTDRTLEIIEKYAAHITKWSSESDGGIYDAMNKGFRQANGQYINFMNAGDLFYNDDSILNLELDNSELSVCGDSIYFSNYSKKIIKYRMNGLNIPHQSLFLNKSIFSVSAFDTTYKYSGDAELWTRILPTHPVVNRQQITSICRFGGVSSNSKYLLPRMKEHLRYEPSKFQVFKRFIPKILLSFFISDILLEKIYFFANGMRFDRIFTSSKK